MTENTDRAFAKRVVRSFVYSGIGNLVGRVIALFGLGIGLLLLDTEEFGASRFALSILAIVRAFTEAGLGVALVQAKKASKSEIDSLFWISLIITGGTYAFVFFVFAPLVPIIWPDISDGASLVRGICFSVALYTFYFVPRAFMERELKFGRLVLIDNISMIVGTSCLFITAYRGHGAWAFVFFEVGQRACQAVLSFAARPFLPALRLDIRGVRKMFQFAMYATGSRILYNLYSQADFLVVARYFGESALGVYGAAWHILSEPIKGLATIVNQVAYPAFARLQDDLTRLRSYFFNIGRVSFAVIGSVLAIVLVYCGPTISAIDALDPKYLAAIPLIWLFSFMGVLKAVAPLIPQLLNAAGHARLNFRYSLLCAIVLPIAFVIGAQFGITGVVLAWTCIYPLVVLVLFYFASSVLDLPLRSIFRIFASIRIVLQTFAASLAIHWLLDGVLALPKGWTAGLGLVLSLTLALVFVYIAERGQIAELRKGPKAT